MALIEIIEFLVIRVAIVSTWLNTPEYVTHLKILADRSSARSVDGSVQIET